ncbi:MAG TPA: LPS export ABC transporter periplasmic protein LptC [Terriglobales bacterium]|jgi:lipopolysaccharide export system protein LptA|nr:LPS export ABC transporter periplasmic protein LptC [Terriglobales bacterium]
MDLFISHLRRWFAIAAVAVCLIVLAVYFHARHSVQNALTQVPDKLGIQVQQSAQDFTISKSDQGRTLFKLQANKAVQFKGGGQAELHDVTITIYGRDSSRFDQVYGKTFEYDQRSGDVTSKGEVSIDLQANLQGASNPDQAAPKELKNPIHVKTTNLVFNQKTGDAWTDSLVEFHVPETSGSAVGARYSAKDNLLTLQSKVNMTVGEAAPLKILAQHAVLGKTPREIVLQHPQTESRQGKGRADEATLFLREDNSLDHAIAVGNVIVDSVASHSSNKQRSSMNPNSAPDTSHVTAQKLEVAMAARNQVKNAVFSGDVHLKTEGTEPVESTAGRAALIFRGHDVLTSIHADQQVKVMQHQGSGAKAQDVAVTAPTIDMSIADGNRLTRAETTGPPDITLLPPDQKSGAQTHITADKFVARFDSMGQISHIHGEAHARVVTTEPPQNNISQPERVSTSDSIDGYFRPGTGIEALLQTGHFTYQAGTQQAFADRARYTPADQVLVLTGTPRILDSGMATTAHSVKLNRATGDGFAEGSVKTTYSDLKAQPDGALLASSDPIHVTAESMTAHNSPSIATYKGNARLWQDANMVEAPTIQFQKDQRMIVADSSSQQKVSTALISTDKSGKSTPIHITSNHLVYRDSERKANYQGEVLARGPDLTLTSSQMEVFFAPASQSAKTAAPGDTPAKLEKIIASGAVVVNQPTRHATGDKLTYTSEDDRFILTGGPPSIFDAERGKITGVSLTLFRRDDRVIVDGSSSLPAVTNTRVVR